MPPGCLALLLGAALLTLFPLLLTSVMLGALGRLGLSPDGALLVLTGILLGGLVNLPVRRIERDHVQPLPDPGLFGLGRLQPGFVRTRGFTIIAVNVGGCIVPCLLAAYEIARIARHGTAALALTLVAVAINCLVCWRVSRPIPGVGIAMPPLVPALVAAACGLLLLPSMAPAVAFTAGVLGPLIGADLLRLRQVEHMAVGVAAIGGAGTFDGIVLSGLIATLLA